MSNLIAIENIKLDGYQAITKPSPKYGSHTLVGEVTGVVPGLAEAIDSALEWCSKTLQGKNQRAGTKRAPTIEAGKLKVNWKPEQCPGLKIVDGAKQPIDPRTPIYSGAVINLVVRVKPWIMPNGDYGCSLRPEVIQVLEYNTLNDEKNSDDPCALDLLDSEF